MIYKIGQRFIWNNRIVIEITQEYDPYVEVKCIQIIGSSTMWYKDEQITISNRLLFGWKYLVNQDAEITV